MILFAGKNNENRTKNGKDYFLPENILPKISIIYYSI
jgi:hypothetical protein